MDTKAMSYDQLQIYVNQLMVENETLKHKYFECYKAATEMKEIFEKCLVEVDILKEILRELQR